MAIFSFGDMAIPRALTQHLFNLGLVDKFGEIHVRYLFVQFLRFMIKRLLSHVQGIVFGKRTIKMGENPSPEVRKKGFNMCKDSVGGVWADLSESDFQIQTLSGGLTNYMYLCSIPNHIEVPDNEPRTVLLRLYGSFVKQTKFLLQNSVVFALMSEKKMGPKLYGMNTEGRIEEYIPSRCLTTVELQNPTISREIARKLAGIHALDMPLCKEPRWLFDTLESWLMDAVKLLKNANKKDVLLQKLLSYELDDEYKVFLEIISNVKSRVNCPVVFAHNDLQEGNILYNEHSADNSNMLTVIDLEYCAYNYRGYDLGNHFIEWCYDYTVQELPKFSFTPEYFPSREQQYVFFRAYLTASGKKDITDKELANMYEEVNTFVLGTHFLWGLWSILQTKMSEIPFGYREYAVSRFDAYFDLKKRLGSFKAY
ncbi:hypothetical protein ACJMK2_020001 [Sinanodonta woodiana]|uniref:Choline/ethanolamine kinase n=1 Tax=Sinanodonta woodiana TaxID=1069815 RepID=A0ABD3U0G6_SINWO